MSSKEVALCDAVSRDCSSATVAASGAVECAAE